MFPILRRVWGPRAVRPVAPSRRRYEWVYVYGFVQPSTGRVEWLLLPIVNTELFELALKYFAGATGASPKKHIVLVLDQAGWHMSKTLQVPDGIHLVPLPPYSPELQPAERLWPLLLEAVANSDPADMDALEEALVDRCLRLRDDHETVYRHSLFHWWAHATEAERLAT